MSNFVVSARKYRPVRFDEVVGQTHVSQTLKNALQNDHLAHAFLFCGPRGVGKTTCARILAKVLNCQNRTDDFEPCNTCDSCQSFNKNASFNITELDAASNNSVDHIRSLVEQVRFQPQQGEYKVFIIDEVHMLSQAAFNAFLKTLEEPPSYAIFILATTEKHKIIPTILSRCQIFDFRRIQVADIVSYLEELCAKESITAESDALHIIAQKADGALRDALSIFDRIVSFSGKSITYDDVIENLNILDYDYYFKIVDALMTSDVAQVLLIFNDILRRGFEPDIFINGLAEHLRNLLVCKDEQTVALLEVSQSLQQKYLGQSQAALASFLLSGLSIANDCDINYKMARNKRLHVEMAIIKMAHIAQAIDLSKNPITVPQAAPVQAPIAEKKNPVVSNSVEQVQEKQSQAEQLPVEQSPDAEQSVNEPPVEQLPITNKGLTDPPISQTPNPPNANKLSSRLKTNPKHQLASLDDLAKEVENESAEEESKEKVEVTLEKVQEVWNEYTQAITSKAAQTSLKNAELAYQEGQIIVTVGSSLAEGHIRKELRDLMPTLHKKLQNKRITLEFNIDSSKSMIHKAPTKPKVLTPKEKFDQMKEQNPLVEKIYKRFDFLLDD